MQAHHPSHAEDSKRVVGVDGLPPIASSSVDHRSIQRRRRRRRQTDATRTMQCFHGQECQRQ